MIAAFVAAASLTSADTWLYHMKVYKPDVDFQMNHWDSSVEEKIQVYKVCEIVLLRIHEDQHN